MNYCVVLAGGRGERFWPLSSRERPKQFLRLFSKKSLIQQTKERIDRIKIFKKCIYVIPEDLVNLLKNEIPEIDENDIIKEPEGKNTAPAIALAAWRLREEPDGVMAVLPADHWIEKLENFKKDIMKAIRIARKEDYLVTFGIPPYFPSTGYGYIKINPKKKLETNVYEAIKFTEKPAYKKAKQYIKSRRYLWNSGMFVWKIKTILDAFSTYMPSLQQKLRKVNFDEPSTIKNFYSKITSESIDYGVMEKAKRVAVVKATFEWDDLGNWLALERHLKMVDKNIILGKIYQMDSKNCIGVAEEGIIALLGVKDLIVAKTKNAVLVSHKERAEDVKKILKLIKGGK